MRAIEVDWSYLRGALAGLLGVAVTGLSIAGLAHQMRSQAEADLASQQSRLHGVAGLYRAALGDRALYGEYVERFRLLERSGVTGPEPRLRWVEALQAANERLRLPKLHYKIAPRHRLGVARSVVRNPDLALYRTTMHLRLALLHEEDLQRLLDALAERSHDRYELRRCKLERSRPKTDASGRGANLEADCRVDWYGMELAAGDQGQAR